MLLKDFNARFTLAQIRGSVWFKRRHPPLTVDHFEQVLFSLYSQYFKIQQKR